MEIWQAVVLGIVEGLTEFLPISSTGHLVVVSGFLGLEVNDRSVIAFNAIIQSGAILAILIYFYSDIKRIAIGWIKGVFKKSERGFDYKFGWYVIVGSLPIAVAGFILSGYVDRIFNLWVVVVGMIGWSFAMWFAERVATQQRGERHINMKDAIFVGAVQVISLFPGVSRAGATMTAGLLRDLDRVTATRLAFFLGIPALVGAGGLEMREAFGGVVPLSSLLVGIIVSAIVAYMSVAWLMRFVANHSFMLFVWYRIGFGLFVAFFLTIGVLTPT